jgi:3-phosphoglycerate kinase
MKTVRDLEIRGKKVLLRCDFNVPLSDKTEITDDYRIRKSLPTIQFLSENGAKIILISHLGSPGGKKSERLKMEPVRKNLEELLKKEVKFAGDCLSPEAEKLSNGLKGGEILLLENLRFHKEEEENDDAFAKKLAGFGEIYINDAFGTSHRAHASIVGIPNYLPSAAGFLLEKEIKVLSEVLENPKRPLIAIIGGVKIATKLKVILKFLQVADHLLFGGKIFEPILQAKGILVGRPWPEKKIMEAIEEIRLTDPKIHIPVDGLASLLKGEGGYSREVGIGNLRKEEEILDIGPETAELYSNLIKEAKMIVWSGPLGRFEKKPFDSGSRKVAEAIVKNRSAVKIAGGGDTSAFLAKYNFREKFDHVSTGGGAMLEFLSGEDLPGIKILEESA